MNITLWRCIPHFHTSLDLNAHELGQLQQAKILLSFAQKCILHEQGLGGRLAPPYERKTVAGEWSWVCSCMLDSGWQRCREHKTSFIPSHCRQNLVQHVQEPCWLLTYSSAILKLQPLHLKHNCTYKIMQETSAAFLGGFSLLSPWLLKTFLKVFTLFSSLRRAAVVISAVEDSCALSLARDRWQPSLTSSSSIWASSQQSSQGISMSQEPYPINKSDSIILYQNNILAFNECNCQYRDSRIMNHYFLLPSTF